MRSGEVCGVFHIIWIRQTTSVQGLQFLEGLLSLRRLTPDLNPVCILCRATSLYNLDDMLGGVCIRWAGCAVACEVIENLARLFASCRFRMSDLAEVRGDFAETHSLQSRSSFHPLQGATDRQMHRTAQQKVGESCTSLRQYHTKQRGSAISYQHSLAPIHELAKEPHNIVCALAIKT